MIVSLAKPQTAAGMTPQQVVDSWPYFRVRPYYHVPDGPSSLKSTLSDWTYECRPVGVSGPEMVLVEFTWETESAPWNRRAIFYPKELHRSTCRCAHCRSDIFTKQDNEELCGAVTKAVSA